MTDKSCLQNPKVVDLITYNSKTDEYALIMVETRDWDGSEERLFEIQNKLNQYLAFALDGEMEQHYPESKSKKLRIQLDCENPTDVKTKRFLEKVEMILHQDGIKFVINIMA